MWVYSISIENPQVTPLQLSNEERPSVIISSITSRTQSATYSIENEVVKLKEPDLSGLDDGIPVTVGAPLDDGDSDIIALGTVDGNTFGIMLMLGASDGKLDTVSLGPSLGSLELVGPVLKEGNAVGCDVGIPVMLGLLLVLGIELGISEALLVGNTVKVGMELGLLLGCREYTSSNKYSSTDTHTSCTSLDPSSNVNVSSSSNVITLSSVQLLSPFTVQVAFQNV